MPASRHAYCQATQRRGSRSNRKGGASSTASEMISPAGGSGGGAPCSAKNKRHATPAALKAIDRDHEVGAWQRLSKGGRGGGFRMLAIYENTKNGSPA